MSPLSFDPLPNGPPTDEAAAESIKCGSALRHDASELVGDPCDSWMRRIRLRDLGDPQ